MGTRVCAALQEPNSKAEGTKQQNKIKFVSNSSNITRLNNLHCYKDATNDRSECLAPPARAVSAPPAAAAAAAVPGGGCVSGDPSGHSQHQNRENNLPEVQNIFDGI
jgi:hypothetical protein